MNRSFLLMAVGLAAVLVASGTAQGQGQGRGCMKSNSSSSSVSTGMQVRIPARMMQPVMPRMQLSNPIPSQSTSTPTQLQALIQQQTLANQLTSQQALQQNMQALQSLATQQSSATLQRALGFNNPYVRAAAAQELARRQGSATYGAE